MVNWRGANNAYFVEYGQAGNVKIRDCKLAPLSLVKPTRVYRSVNVA